MGTIIWLAGVVLSILAIIDITKKPISTGWKIGWSVILLITGWIGLIVYYVYAKNKIVDWSK